MKNIALILPLATVLLLSACDNANNQIDTNPNTQSSENIDTQTNDTQINDAQINDKVNTPTDEKIEDKPQAPDTLVNNDSLKKETIESLYRDTVLSYKNNANFADDLDTLFTYADKDLQNAVALVKADPLNTGDSYTNGPTKCNEVRYILNLSVGNGYGIDQAVDVKYKVLGNGNVRASIMLDANHDIEASDFDNYKDFSLNCSQESCKVTDMFDSYGDSAKQEADKYCR